MKKLAGWLSVFTLIGYLLSLLEWVPVTVATVLAWLTMLTVWPSLTPTARKQSTLLFILGFALLIFAYSNNIAIDWTKVLATNVPLLALFVAISFLALTNNIAPDESLPVGKRAIATTAIGTNILGAVINLSVVFVFGDRLQRKGKLSDQQQIVLSRCFSAAAWWSPFFVATGVALMYSPGMQWRETFVPGVIMAILGVSYTMLEVYRKRPPEFHGYPLKLESLTIPTLLAFSVLVLHEIFPSISIVILITLLSILGSIVFIAGRPRRSTLISFVSERLYTSGAQFSLFLAAGVFASGINALILMYPELISFHELDFDASTFSVASLIMIVTGLFGVHPVITIAIASSLLTPLNPNPTSLGFLYLTTWAISTGASPLSGIGLVMTSRYHASSRKILKNNWRYVAVMWFCASCLNWMLFN